MRSRVGRTDMTPEMVGEIRSANIGAAFAIRAEPGSKGRDALMAVGLLLTTATQLRLPGSPLGPGEVCLVIWIALTLIRKHAA
jgi:hypothetical protein